VICPAVADQAVRAGCRPRSSLEHDSRTVLRGQQPSRWGPAAEAAT